MGIVFFARKSLSTNTNNLGTTPASPRHDNTNLTNPPAKTLASTNRVLKPLTLRNRIFLKSLRKSFFRNE